MPLILLTFFVFITALSFGEDEIISAGQCITHMITAAKLHWETPLHAVYKQQTTYFYPKDSIIENLSDGKVKIKKCNYSKG